MSNLDVYLSAVPRKPTLWNVRPRVVQFRPAFKRAFPWSRERHARRAVALRRLVSYMDRKHSELVDSSTRLYGFTPPLTCAVVDSTWPEHIKSRLRALAYPATSYRDAQAAHEREAGITAMRRFTRVS